MRSARRNSSPPRAFLLESMHSSYDDEWALEHMSTSDTPPTNEPTPEQAVEAPAEQTSEPGTDQDTPEPQDITRASLIERVMPNWFGPYIRLARLDRPIGIWLLLFPCWWSMTMALPHAELTSQWQPLWYATLFAIGAIVMRGAGCTINDILDRKVDAQVARTRDRPLPAGEVSLIGAILFALVLCLIGLAVLIQFNIQTITIGALSLIFVVIYPLMKRVTFWPQLFLGLTFNWGAFVGWVAMTSTLSWPPILLYVGAIFWTSGYDTIYAFQDRRDDVRVGVKSTAVRLAEASPFWVGVSYAIAWICWVLAIWGASLGNLYTLLFMIPVAIHFFWQISTWRPLDPANSLSIFKSNRWVGWLALMAMIGVLPAG